MCPSAPRVCCEPGGQKPVLSLSLDLIEECWCHCKIHPVLTYHYLLRRFQMVLLFECSCRSEFETKRPEQNGRPFADDNFSTFSQWTSSNLNKIWFKCVPMGRIGNKSSLFQAILLGAKPLSEPILTKMHVVIWRYYATIMRWTT